MSTTALSSDVTYRASGFARAHSLALQGKINRGETWNPPSDPKPDDCLAQHASATAGTKGRQAYPIVKGNTLYRAGIIACKQRAAQQDEPEIISACDRLLKIIDEKKGVTSASVNSRRKISGLRSGPTTYSDKSVVVDADNGIIKNAAVITVGPAVGHGFSIDSTTVDQLVALAAAQPDGVKCRFKHPEIEDKAGLDGNVIQKVSDDSGTMIGRIKNVRRDGDQARGDIYLGSYAEILPGQGNVKEYLIRHAQDDPAGVALSAMFEFDVEEVADDFGNITDLLARLSKLYAIDVVGEAAANPNGLLSASAGWSDPNPRDPATAPIPVSTPDFPTDNRAKVLRALVEHGAMGLGGLVRHAAFSGRLQELRADADWLVAHKLAEHVAGAAPAYKATPAGMSRAALCWK